MKEVHQLESVSQSDMIENLQDQLAAKAEVNLRSEAKERSHVLATQPPWSTNKIENLYFLPFN
jgi:hypothetical protein